MGERGGRSDFPVPDPSVPSDLESSKCPRQQKRDGAAGPPDRPEPGRGSQSRAGVAQRDLRGRGRGAPWVPGSAGRGAGAEGQRLPRGPRSRWGGEAGSLRGHPVRGQSGCRYPPGRGHDRRRAPGPAVLFPHEAALEEGRVGAGACGAPGFPPSPRRGPRPSRHSPRRRPPRHGAGATGCVKAVGRATFSAASRRRAAPRLGVRRPGTGSAAGGRPAGGSGQGRGGADLVTPGGLRGSLGGRETPSRLGPGWRMGSASAPSPG